MSEEQKQEIVFTNVGGPQHEKYPDAIPKFRYNKFHFMVNHDPNPTLVLVRDDKDHEKAEEQFIDRTDVAVLTSVDGFEIIMPAPVVFACSSQMMSMFDPMLSQMITRKHEKILLSQDFSDDPDDVAKTIYTGYLLERVVSSFFYNVKYDECPQTYEEPVTEDDAEALILVAEYFDC